MIYVLTGAIQTGKTSALIKWCEGRNDVFGIFTPVVNGKRFFMDARTKKQFQMEANDNEKETISIGRFDFSKVSFEKAIKIVRDEMNKKGWLVIDEIGPLELRKEGFHNVIRQVLKSSSSQLLFVVREGLVDKVTELFELEQFDIITKEKLKEL